MSGFSVTRRNFGHWDIATPDGRIRIRGVPGDYFIRDERKGHEERNLTGGAFNTLAACMTVICDDLMYELIVAEGQSPVVIKPWNVS